MTRLSKLLIGVGTITGVVVVGIMLSNKPGNVPEANSQPAVSESEPTEPEPTNRSTVFTKRIRRSTAQAATDSQASGATTAGTNLMPGWEDKVDEVLGSSSPDSDKARQMLEMLPQLPADGQEEVVRHLSNLLSDQDYGLMRGYLTNTSLPEAVQDVLLDDILNRPNSLKLSALLDVARTAQHPKAAEAKDFLELFLEEDYGSDWEKWQAKVDQWLTENPD